nr:putative reverse transcriptase domain-containing protein [Tanacetum cinerariifolium]
PPFSGTIYVGSGSSRKVFAPDPIGKDVDILHRKVKAMSQAAIERLITQRVNAALEAERVGRVNEGGKEATKMKQEAKIGHLQVNAALEAERASRVNEGEQAGRTNERGEGINGNETGGQDRAPPARECTFSSFMKCNPTPFHGKEGAIELCRWFEKSEMVFSISDCAEKNKVKFDAATLQGRALTWWNSQVATLGLNVEIGKSWDDMKKMMLEEFCLDEERKVL